jgi:hypothetical protein
VLRFELELIKFLGTHQNILSFRFTAEYKGSSQYRGPVAQ